VSLTLVFSVSVVWLLILAYPCSVPPTDSFHTNAGGSAGQIDALGANTACCVCHIAFVKERITEVGLTAQPVKLKGVVYVR
jgi:hypothetical protein